MFTTPCFIHKNTPELRKKLEELGYKPQIIERSDNGSISLREDCFWTFSGDIENRDGSFGIDCGDNEPLFLALAALRDDSDYMQWFCDNRSENWVMCKDENNPKHLHRGGRGWWTEHGLLHKASVEEILEHFKR